MSNDSTDWLPPSQPEVEGDGSIGGGEQAVPSAPLEAGAPARPAYGAYGTPPAGQAAPANGLNPYSGPNDFFVAPKPGIIPLRPLGVGDIISGAFESLRANPKAMFIPALLTMTVIGAINAAGSYVMWVSSLDILLTSSTGQPATPEELKEQMPSLLLGLASELGSLVVTLLATTVLTGLLIMTVSRSALGRVVSAGEVWSRVKGRVWALIGQSILVGLISFTTIALLGGPTAVALVGIVRNSTSSLPSWLAVLVILFVIAVAILMIALSLVFMVRFTCASSALILEDIGIIESLKRSWGLSRGSFWRVLGTLLLAGLITGTALGLLSLPISFLTLTSPIVGEGALPLMAAIQSFLSALLQAIVLPFSAAVSALIYIDLRMRNEGLDVELRRAAQA